MYKKRNRCLSVSPALSRAVLTSALSGADLCAHTAATNNSVWPGAQS